MSWLVLCISCDRCIKWDHISLRHSIKQFTCFVYAPRCMHVYQSSCDYNIWRDSSILNALTNLHLKVLEFGFTSVNYTCTLSNTHHVRYVKPFTCNVDASILYRLKGFLHSLWNSPLHLLIALHEIHLFKIFCWAIRLRCPRLHIFCIHIHNSWHVCASIICNYVFQCCLWWMSILLFEAFSL